MEAQTIWLALSAAMLFIDHSASASEYANRRVRDAAAQMSKFALENRDLKKSEVLLYTIDPPISRTQLLSAINKKGVTVSAVHACPSQGGAIAFFIDPSYPLDTQLQTIEKDSYKDVISKIPSNRPTLVPATGVIPMEPLSFCGFEVKANRDAMRELSQTLGNRVKVVELTSARMKRLPINRSD